MRGLFFFWFSNFSSFFHPLSPPLALLPFPPHAAALRARLGLLGLLASWARDTCPLVSSGVLGGAAAAKAFLLFCFFPFAAAAAAAPSAAFRARPLPLASAASAPDAFISSSGPSASSSSSSSSSPSSSSSSSSRSGSGTVSCSPFVASALATESFFPSRCLRSAAGVALMMWHVSEQYHFPSKFLDLVSSGGSPEEAASCSHSSASAARRVYLAPLWRVLV